MLTAQRSPTTLAAQMNTLSVKRPSLALARKRKRSDAIQHPDQVDENEPMPAAQADSGSDCERASPTSPDELATPAIVASSTSADESSVISPKKKARASEGGKWGGKSQQQEPQPKENENENEENENSVAASEPFAFSGAPAEELEEVELAILAFFLS